MVAMFIIGYSFVAFYMCTLGGLGARPPFDRWFDLLRHDIIRIFLWPPQSGFSLDALSLQPLACKTADYAPTYPRRLLWCSVRGTGIYSRKVPRVFLCVVRGSTRGWISGHNEISVEAKAMIIPPYS